MRERVQGLVHTQALDIGPFEHAGAQTRHGLGIGRGVELDVLGAAQGLDALDQLAQGITDPGNDHGPALDAAQAVDAFFLGAELEEIFNGVAGGFAHQALDFDRPGRGLKFAGQARGVGLVGAELVEVVVGAGVFVVGAFFHGGSARHAGAHRRQRGELAGALHHLRTRIALRPARQGDACAAAGQPPEHVTPLVIDRLRRDLAGDGVNEPVAMGFDQHDVPRNKTCS